MILLPNHLTILRMFLTPVFVILFWIGGAATLPAILIFIIASVTDSLDGYLARRLDKMSDWGAFWDPLADKVLVGSAFICFAFKALIAWWVVALIFFRDFLVTHLRMYTLKKGYTLQTTKLAKFKTVMQVAAIYGIFAQVWVHQGFAGSALDAWTTTISQAMVYGMLGLVVYTGLDYALKIWMKGRGR